MGYDLKGLVSFIILLCVMLPLGIWKLVEIIYWLIVRLTNG